MRARDNKHRAEELGAVVRWLRSRAAEMLGDAQALERLDRPSLAPVVARCRAEAQGLCEAAERLERGEHHDQF